MLDACKLCSKVKGHLEMLAADILALTAKTFVVRTERAFARNE